MYFPFPQTDSFAFFFHGSMRYLLHTCKRAWNCMEVFSLWICWGGPRGSRLWALTQRRSMFPRSHYLVWMVPTASHTAQTQALCSRLGLLSVRYSGSRGMGRKHWISTQKPRLWVVCSYPGSHRAAEKSRDGTKITECVSIPLTGSWWFVVPRLHLYPSETSWESHCGLSGKLTGWTGGYQRLALPPLCMWSSPWIGWHYWLLNVTDFNPGGKVTESKCFYWISPNPGEEPQSIFLCVPVAYFLFLIEPSLLSSPQPKTVVSP